jgi:hypothetical protein
VDAIKGVPDRAWHPEEKYWSIPTISKGFDIVKVQHHHFKLD